MNRDKYFRYIGKTHKSEDGGYIYHLLVYHLLDVTAVAKEFLTIRTDVTDFFVRTFSFNNKESFINFFLFFVALHDLGKFSITFQNILPGIWEAFPEYKPDKKIERYKWRHDTLGYLYWDKELKKWFEKDLNLKKIVEWVGVASGHHGKPPKKTGSFPVKTFFFEEDRLAIKSWIDCIYSMFLSKVDFLPILENNRFKNKSKTFSWWLAGLTVLADWLGSNSDYFKYSTDLYELTDYWETAQTTAKKVIHDSGLARAIPSDTTQFDSFFNFKPTPLQKKVSEIQLVNGPQLFILEDVTGSGKTEAALYLTHRLISNGYAGGLYFALPTKATADAIYTRAGKYYHKLYRNDQKPSFLLSHGSRNLNKDFCKSILQKNHTNEVDLEENSDSASTYCNNWLADNQKKALLAEVGIGTIDQSLISALPQKHQSLRLLGLFGKVLVVDEVHSYDPYMNELLCKLIRFQASIGSSTILMSATIPQSLKQRLVDAYCEGFEIAEINLHSMDFPLLTHVHINTDNPIEEHIETREEVERTVKVNLIHKEAEVHELIVRKLQAGYCVCWIRNTVADVQRAYSELSETIPDLINTKYPVFHARFCLGDRLDAESDIISRFGKNGDKATRTGQLVIASQVIEQSLDVDFDVLITDLAPIDAIIQRAGRLQRHVRDDQGVLHNEKCFQDPREPILYVFSPDPIDDPPEDWYSSVFPKGQYVYKNVNQLWRTAKKLKAIGAWKMPENARELIEDVYGSFHFDIQPNLLKNTLETEGSMMAEKEIAKHFGLKQNIGYLETENWDDTRILTRLNLNTTNVYLAKWINGSLFSWYDHESWEYSQLRISGYSLPKTFEIEEKQLREAVEGIKDSFREKKPLILPLVESDEGWITAVIVNDETKEFTYDPKFGFHELNDGS